MKILVFSDTHRKYDKMYEIINEHKNTANLVIHLGDLQSDVEKVMIDFPQIPFLSVAGNCDVFQGSIFEKHYYTFNFESHKILITHGHMFNVRNNLYSLLNIANKEGCDIALYGHTHIAKHLKIGNVDFFNPGSITEPRDYTNGTFGIINIEKNKTEFLIKEIDK